MMNTKTPWHDTPLWLRNLIEDGKIYNDSAAVTIGELARTGCPVSMANARAIWNRIMGGV